ncbi:hypothetical protein J2S14_001395 [Lederbergia wuyishanensis]|uniref:Uncharacterized protein n=1 Tax=Lederbergia wuyishanensis TaxID=1347903 RepID=A0ABU0D2H0_9BACI|nr:hypothetical protein [Lederbergia wuyishanensis]
MIRYSIRRAGMIKAEKRDCPKVHTWTASYYGTITNPKPA